MLWSTSVSPESLTDFFKIVKESVRLIPTDVESEHPTKEEKECIPEEW